jgi:hypothetical protein
VAVQDGRNPSLNTQAVRRPLAMLAPLFRGQYIFMICHTLLSFPRNHFLSGLRFIAVTAVKHQPLYVPRLATFASSRV